MFSDTASSGGAFALAVAEAADDAGLAFLVSSTRDGTRAVAHASSGAVALLGYSPTDLTGMTLQQLLVAADQENKTSLNLDFDGSHVEALAVCKDGTRIPVDVTSRQTQNGPPGTTVTFLVDISQRRKASAELSDSEARFRAVVESAPDGVAILRGPTILYLNAAAASMLGYSEPKEAIGGSISDLLHPDDAPIAAERVALLMQKREGLMGPTEYRSWRRNGTPMTAEISSIPIEYEGAPAVLAFARDVTERKAIQARLIQADRLAAVGTLAAGVAHEINNPLTYILLGLRYLERELATLGGDPARTGRLMNRIRESQLGAERVAAIVRDLKSFARSDEDTSGPVAIVPVLEVALKLAENEIRHRARLVRHFDNVPLVHGNAARLEQVFLNLLVNAAQALPNGDPTRDEIRVSAKAKDDGHVLVTVSDTGVGIPEDIRDRVFDPFFTTKPVGIGTGLGLAICQGIVTGFGGKIEIESRSEVGTTVFVTLPRHARGFGFVEAEPVSAAEGATQRARLLIIDDEPFVGRLLASLLGLSHEVRVTASAREALDTLEQGAFDAILCDLMMPGMSGMEFYEALTKKHPGLEERVIFMTGGAFVQTVADFIGRVPNPVLDKPFDVEVIMQAVQKVVGRTPSPSEEST